jgi:hypothetical protein
MFHGVSPQTAGLPKLGEKRFHIFNSGGVLNENQSRLAILFVFSRARYSWQTLQLFTQVASDLPAQIAGGSLVNGRKISAGSSLAFSRSDVFNEAF